MSRKALLSTASLSALTSRLDCYEYQVLVQLGGMGAVRYFLEVAGCSPAVVLERFGSWKEGSSDQRFEAFMIAQVPVITVKWH